MGNARRSSAFDIPPRAITTRHRPSPCSRWRKGEGERLETADRVRVCTPRSLATRAHEGRGGAGQGGAGGRKTHSTSMFLVCLRSPGSKFSTVLSSSSLWYFTMTSVRDLGGRGRIGSVTWTRTRSYTCRCTYSMCNVNVTFVGYGCRSMIQCDLIVCSFVLELRLCCENRLS